MQGNPLSKAQQAIDNFLNEDNWELKDDQWTPKETAWQALEAYENRENNRPPQTYYKINAEYDGKNITLGAHKWKEGNSNKFSIALNSIRAETDEGMACLFPRKKQTKDAFLQFKGEVNAFDQYFNINEENNPSHLDAGDTATNQEPPAASQASHNSALLNSGDHDKRLEESASTAPPPSPTDTAQEQTGDPKSSSFLPRWLQSVFHFLVSLFSTRKADQWFPDVAKPKVQWDTNTFEDSNSNHVPRHHDLPNQTDHHGLQWDTNTMGDSTEGPKEEKEERTNTSSNSNRP